MSTRLRDEEAVRLMYQRINARVSREDTPSEGDGAWVEALKWVLGGCVDPYHPPECSGDLDSCYGEGGGR